MHFIILSCTNLISSKLLEIFNEYLQLSLSFVYRFSKRRKDNLKFLPSFSNSIFVVEKLVLIKCLDKVRIGSKKF